MLLSMTGYGKGESYYQENKIVTEIKSLNAKVTDIRVKSPVPLGEKELDLRNIVQNEAYRGKFELTLHFEGIDELEAGSVNKRLVKKYLTDLLEIAEESKIAPGDLLGSIIRLPNVVITDESNLSDELWEKICTSVRQGLERLQQFRAREGAVIQEELSSRVQIIVDLLDQVDEAAEGRIDALRKRLKQRIEEYLSNEQVDQNRFEQELLFYIEKLDITEEKVRLAQHCTYFTEVLHQGEVDKGKKLSFISQEMGREINTLGAKAQWSPIQRIVVAMKDELEKIKEQIANVL